MSNEYLVTTTAASITTAVLKDFLNHMPNLIRNLTLGTGIDLCHDFNPEEVGCLSGQFVVVQSLSCALLFVTHGLQYSRLLCPSLFPTVCSTHVHWVSDAIQPSYPLSPPSPPALNLSQHQGLLQWVGFSHEVAKVLEFQLQHQSFQWIFRIYFL